jgi:RNA polymerase sigma-70 factor (ECF subfamily)
MESVSFGFLLALEALTPRQRAVLLLRDVFDYAVEDTAAALDMTVANVKTTHHRARHAMAAYDRTRVPSSSTHTESTRAMLGAFLAALRADDPATVESLLAADVRSTSDGGGAVIAARVPIVGRAKVARFFRKIVALNGAASTTRVALVNGLPALVVTMDPASPPGIARRFVTALELDAAGRIRRIYSVLAPPKLGAIRQ